MNWGSYLAFGIIKPSHPKIIYHMCITNEYNQQIKENNIYYPPTYQQDGFIHATADPSLLLSIGTYFYKNDLNDWICLEIDTEKLISPVKYEPAAPVGSTPTKPQDQSKPEPLFPHIYGGINPESVTVKYNIVRSLDGSFHSIDGLVSELGNLTL